MITLGLDVGTTRTKVLALDALAGRTLALEVAPTPLVRDASGDAHDPSDVLQTVATLMRRVVRSLAEPSRVRAVSVASVGEEVVLLDAAGRPMGDAIAWYDPRGAEEADGFMRGAGAELELSRRWPPDPSFSLFKLLWLLKHRPDDLRRAVTWTDLGDHVLAGLGGEVVMDWTHASRAGAFDLVGRRWDPATIRAAGLEGLAFPRLVPSGTPVGTVSPSWARELGLPDGVAVVTGGHDHLCAAWAGGLRDTPELFLSAGTSEAHLALSAAPVEGSAGRYHLDQGCYVDADTYYVHVNIHSGHVFGQWRELLYPGVDEEVLYAEVEAAESAARVAHADPPDRVAAAQGDLIRGGADAAGPVFDLLDDLRHARLDRIPYSAGRAELMRAVLVGLARRSADIVASLEGATGRRFELVLATGQPTRRAYWRRLRAAVYGRPMAVVEEPESAALGAAMLAARALGADDAGGISVPRTTWHPRAADGGPGGG